ncbi:MAG: MFS transporter [Candidatus Binatia bacterium]
MSKRPPLSLPFHYAWFVLVVSFLTTLTGAGIRSSPSVMINPFEAEFGWNRAAIAAAISLNLLLFGVAAPISGRLMDRYGPRVVMIGGLLTLAAGVIGTTFMTALWQLVLLWGVVVGLAAGGTSSVLSATVAQRWFVARRGLALGLLNSASSTGQLIILPTLMVIIVASGWRAGSMLLAVTCIVLACLVFFFMRNDPSEVGLEAFGEGSPEAQGKGAAALRHARGSSDVSMWDVIRNPTFWLLCGSFFICGGTANGLVGTHLIPHSIDHGIPQVTAAATLGIMGGMNFVGTVFSGWLTDRIDTRKLLAMVYALRGLSLFILPFVTDYSQLFIFAVVYGLDWFATVPPTIALTGDTFGKNAIGTVYGWIFLSHQLGAALMALGGGVIRVWLGDYSLAFVIGGALGLIAAGLALNIPLPARTAAAPVPAPVAGS